MTKTVGDLGWPFRKRLKPLLKDCYSRNMSCPRNANTSLRTTALSYLSALPLLLAAPSSSSWARSSGAGG